jgi:hypothetical protein
MAYGDLVEGLVALEEGQAGFVGPGILLAEEVVGPEDGCDLVYGFGVDEEGGDHSLFRFDVVGGKLLS